MYQNETDIITNQATFPFYPLKYRSLAFDYRYSFIPCGEGVKPAVRSSCV